MLIPGLPPPGAQQEVFKPDRKVTTTAADGLAHDPLAELPVEEDALFQQAEQHAEENSSMTSETPEGADTEGDAELPSKGLLVDIRI